MAWAWRVWNWLVGPRCCRCGRHVVGLLWESVVMDGRECLAVLVAVWAVAFAVWLLLRECYSKEADCLDYKNERCVVSRFADVPLDPDQSEYGTPEEFMELVCEVDENGSGLTAWEIDFIAAHIDDPPHQPTDRQWEALLKIQEERM